MAIFMFSLCKADSFTYEKNRKHDIVRFSGPRYIKIIFVLLIKLIKVHI